MWGRNASREIEASNLQVDGTWVLYDYTLAQVEFWPAGVLVIVNREMVFDRDHGTVQVWESQGVR